MMDFELGLLKMLNVYSDGIHLTHASDSRTV